MKKFYKNKHDNCQDHKAQNYMHLKHHLLLNKVFRRAQGSQIVAPIHAAKALLHWDFEFLRYALVQETE